MKHPKSIYIHLPFCKTKCPYCDFASFTESSKEIFASYINALLQEIDYRCRDLGPEKPEIETIFFGGGTPSVHSASEIEEILSKLKEYFLFADDIEITLEANPGTAYKAKLKGFQELGINRISFGAQTFDEDLLLKLGRGHSLADTYQTLENIIDLDFESWSFDLIYGLPGQSLESWQATLDEALKFKPPHISAYALSIEKNTPYGSIYKNSEHPDLPLEDELVQMYEKAHSEFEKHGLTRYEISNWSVPGREARHNLTYWRAEEYFAFGLSAHGYFQQYRYANTRDLKEYIANIEQGNFAAINVSHEYIDAETKLEEQLMLQIRLKEGLNLESNLIKIVNLDKLNFFLDQGLIEKSDQKIRLSTKGVLLSNRVIAELAS